MMMNTFNSIVDQSNLAANSAGRFGAHRFGMVHVVCNLSVYVAKIVSVSFHFLFAKFH